MEQPKLVIASVLKPVTDTRMYEKIGRSISQTKKYEVNIIGFYRKNLPEEPNIKFHPIFNFTRLSFSRIFCGVNYFFKLLQLRPKWIICSTHELLIPSALYSVLTSAKLIYDVQENYLRNVLFTDAFPQTFRYPLALWIRLKEYLTRPIIYHYLLAEQCYQDELSFIENKYKIIENKALLTPKNKAAYQPSNLNIIQLIFTGTIAPSTGVFECIKLAKSLQNIEAKIRLKIVGYCAQESVLKQVKESIQNSDFIELIGGDKLVEHDVIINQIQSADFGLIYYPPNKANDSSIPTKLYEYLAHELPIIMDDKPHFTRLTNTYPASINVDFNKPDARQILEQIKNNKFYETTPKNEVLWTSEAFKIISIINS
jgi:glycosyltransferase involved in cell wall biosynthesis